MVETPGWAYHRQDHFRKGRAAFVPPGGGGEEVVRLHLGCGKKRFRGYLNVDSLGGDVHWDICKPEVPDDCLEEIIGIHVFEHLYYEQACEALKTWYRKLKVGGKLILEMPDLEKVLGFFLQKEIHIGMTMHALYGAEHDGRIENIHKWAWAPQSIKPELEKAGFTKIETKPAIYHVRERDFRVEATK